MSLLASSTELFQPGPSLGLARMTDALGLAALMKSASYELLISKISRSGGQGPGLPGMLRRNRGAVL